MTRCISSANGWRPDESHREHHDKQQNRNAHGPPPTARPAHGSDVGHGRIQSPIAFSASG